MSQSVLKSYENVNFRSLPDKVEGVISCTFPSERNFLRVMAELEAYSKSTSDIAAKLKFKIHQIGPVRAKLIKKGMIYSPASGEVAFTAPLFGDFMKRIMPLSPIG